MKELTTEKSTLGLRFNQEAFNLHSIEDAAKELLKSPSTPWRDMEEIPYWQKYFIDEKATSKGLAEGQIRHYISTSALDRDSEIMTPKGVDLKHYRKNPVVMWGHDYYQPENIVGKNLEITKTDSGLLALTQFNLIEAKAAQVYRLYAGGWIKAWSVGFIPIKGHKPEQKEIDKLGVGEVRYIHDKWGLLEYSAVSIPSNPDALTLSVAKELNLSTKMIEELEIVLKEIPEVKDDNNKVILDLGDVEQKEEGKEETEGANKTEGEKVKYNCECIECGHKLKSEKHCVDIKCPKCGGEMRRAERPGEGRDIEGGITKPSENNHVCTINSGDYEKYRSDTREHEGKSYTVRFGIKADGTSEENEYFYSIDTWTAEEAKTHCNSHDGKFAAATKPKADDNLPDKGDISPSNSDKAADAIYALTEEITLLKMAIEEKAGRELSTKNRTLIKTCVEAMAKATEALGALLAATEPDEEEKDTTVIAKHELDLSALLHKENIDLEELGKKIAETIDISKLVTDSIKDKQ